MYKQRIQMIAREASFPIISYAPDHFTLTSEIIADLRVKSYFDQWRTALDNGWFHLRLDDHSLFLFCEGASPSYSFLHCPLDLVSFAEFLEISGLENVPENRRMQSAAYDNVIETASLKPYVTPIRFDYHPAGYNPGVHPVGHIHVGLDNSVRLSSNKMNSVAFVLFVMRHMYPKAWSRLLAKMGLTRVSALVRAPGSHIPIDFWTAADEVELYFR